MDVDSVRIPDSPDDILGRILRAKTDEVRLCRGQRPESEVRAQAEQRNARRPFEARLAQKGSSGVNIIAEIKRASPSKGPIRADLKLEQFARAYTSGGAAAISVLTDRHFQGDPQDLGRVRSLTPLPLLRKDFIISTYQIHEAVVLGADAVLLIVRVLFPEFLRTCLDLCRELELGALVEVHDEAELDEATGAGAKLIGVNNRDLRTFHTDLAISERLVRRLEPNQVMVAESGIRSRADIQRLEAAGVWNFLIGESLVRAEHPESFLRSLQGMADKEDRDR
ncbi:MAG TPA: indole-3-glycerol phosphate synthase TrpC [Syntrophobacteraceae bacterium]|nr:indole-3-glycerol phosphate synthase TrpC [Syntrophobacteraceae bacterium]